MSNKSINLYPFYCIIILPKGHPFGLKKREYIRKSFHKKKQEAEQEGINLLKTGAISYHIVDRFEQSNKRKINKK